MSIFSSTHIVKLDAKGRVSVPSAFRGALSGENFQGVVLVPSHTHAALEGFSATHMANISRRLDHFDLFSEDQDDIATAIFGGAVQLPFDGDGRIVLPRDLISFAKMTDTAAFIGLGNKFQMWEPGALDARIKNARTQVQKKKLTLPREGA